MRGETPPISLKRWLGLVASSGSIIDWDSQVIIHHIAGRKAKQDGYQVGHILVLPLTPQQHDWIHMGGDAGLENLTMHYGLANLALFDPEIETMSLAKFEMFLWSQVLNRVPLPGWDVEISAASNWTRS